MKTIYAVSCGSYSDYSVYAIFSTRKLAKEFMAAIPDSDYNEIEEYELDPPQADLVKRGYSVWRVLMLKNGDVEDAQTLEIEAYTAMSTGHYIWERTKALAYQGKGIPDCLQSTVWAKTKKQAVKIVNEHRTAMIASGKWK